MPEEALLLEHINLNIPDEEEARAFYIDGLGGVENPVSSNERQLHVNIGVSQWHLLTKTCSGDGGDLEPVRVPQRWPGHVELWTTEPLDDIHRRLPRERQCGSEPDRILCTCPWGNVYDVRRAPVGYRSAGSHPGGCGTLVAMRRAVHPVPPGSAGPLFEFWTGVLGCSADLGGTPSSCTMRFATGQELVFEEREGAPAANAYDSDNDSAGYHVCLYLTLESFARALKEVETRGLLYANPRFAAGPPEFGNAMNWDEAWSCGQFRVKDLRGTSSEDNNGGRGVLGLMLELEVRSTKHVSCPL